ncbi:UNVERIFIED_ORG: putative phage-associated protein [Paraburkholderia sediminicola]|nr:putative phage-associated protein [Paraburkholderia sediminicola]
MAELSISEKTKQVILYVAGRLGEKGNLYKVLKAIYFADKEHLHEFGRFITSEQYKAMQHGPVPWHAYTEVSGVRDSRVKQARASGIFTVTDENTIVPFVEADMSIFSKSELLCLDKAIETLRPLSFGQVKTMSHDAAYRNASFDDAMSVESIAAMSQDRDVLISYLNSRH